MEKTVDFIKRYYQTPLVILGFFLVWQFAVMILHVREFILPGIDRLRLAAYETPVVRGNPVLPEIRQMTLERIVFAAREILGAKERPILLQKLRYDTASYADVEVRMKADDVTEFQCDVIEPTAEAILEIPQTRGQWLARIGGTRP